MSLIDINEECGTKAVSRLEEECESWIGRILFIKCDVTNEDEFEGASLWYKYTYYLYRYIQSHPQGAEGATSSRYLLFSLMVLTIDLTTV